MRTTLTWLQAGEIGEPRLPPALAVLTAAGLYATLPDKFVGGSSGFLLALRWIVPALALLLVPPLALTAPRRRIVLSVRRRTAAIALIAVISAANGASIVLLVHLIVNGHKIGGHELVRAAIHIWCVNVIVRQPLAGRPRPRVPWRVDVADGVRMKGVDASGERYRSRGFFVLRNP